MAHDTRRTVPFMATVAAVLTLVAGCGPGESPDLAASQSSEVALSDSVHGNHGIRTMATGHGAFYLGTANAMNMHPEGGWELIQLKPRSKH